jgi:hypothetical protein
MIKKFNLFKESSSEIEQLKQDVKDSLLDFCDEFGYELGKNIFVFTTHEYEKQNSNTSSNISFSVAVIKTIKLIIKIVYEEKEYSNELKDVIERFNKKQNMLTLVYQSLERFEGDKKFEEKPAGFGRIWNWYILIKK